MARVIYSDVYTQQPAQAADIAWDSQARHLLHAPTLYDPAQRMKVLPGGSETLAVGSLGLGLNVAASTNRWISATTTNVPTAAAQDFTIEVLLTMTAAPSLSHIFGFNGNGDPNVVNAAFNGKFRALLAFSGGSNRNIYFWGYAADLASGVDWRIDGSVQHVFVTRSGTSMRFWRDGRQIGSGTTPTLVASNPLYAAWGSRHSSGTAAPTMKVYKSAYYPRALTSAEILARTINPWLDFAPARSLPVNSAAAATFVPAWAMNRTRSIGMGHL
jgi:hypothetical protein